VGIETRRIVAAQVGERAKVKKSGEANESESHKSYPITIMNFQQGGSIRPKGGETQKVLCKIQEVADELVAAIRVSLGSHLGITSAVSNVGVFECPNKCPTELENGEDDRRESFRVHAQFSAWEFPPHCFTLDLAWRELILMFTRNNNITRVQLGERSAFT